MSDHPLRPALSLSLVILLLLAFPQISRSQSATATLGQMTGQQIGRFQSTSKPMVGMGGGGGMGANIGGMVGSMMIQSIIGGLLDGSPNKARQAAQQAAQQAELEAWLKAEQQRLYQQVKQQRAKRDAQDTAGMEEMAKAMGSGFDTAMPNSDLASALSDPKLVDLRPNANIPVTGDANVVDLRDRTREVPIIPGGPKQALKVAKKLQEMIKDNQDPAKLDKNLQKLEDQLAAARRLSEKLERQEEVSRKDLEAWDRSVGQAAKEGLQRGLSLAMDFGDQARSGQGAMLSRLKEQQANPAKWDQTLGHLNNLNDFAQFSEGLTAKGRPLLQNLDWGQARTTLTKDLDATHAQFKSPDQNFQSGKAMIDKSLDVAQAREAAYPPVKGEEKLTAFFWDKKKKVDAATEKLASLTDNLRGSVSNTSTVALKPAKATKPDADLELLFPGKPAVFPKNPDKPLLNPLIELPKGQSLPQRGESADAFFQRLNQTRLGKKIAAEEYRELFLASGQPYRRGQNPAMDKMVDQAFAEINRRETDRIREACRKAVKDMNGEWDRMEKQGIIRAGEDLIKKEEMDAGYRNALMSARQRVYAQLDKDIRAAKVGSSLAVDKLKLNLQELKAGKMPAEFLGGAKNPSLLN